MVFFHIVIQTEIGIANMFHAWHEEKQGMHNFTPLLYFLNDNDKENASGRMGWVGRAS